MKPQSSSDRRLWHPQIHLPHQSNQHDARGSERQQSVKSILNQCNKTIQILHENGAGAKDDGVTQTHLTHQQKVQFLQEAAKTRQGLLVWVEAGSCGATKGREGEWYVGEKKQPTRDEKTERKPNLASRTNQMERSPKRKLIKATYDQEASKPDRKKSNNNKTAYLM